MYTNLLKALRPLYEAQQRKRTAKPKRRVVLAKEQQAAQAAAQVPEPAALRVAKLHNEIKQHAAAQVNDLQGAISESTLQRVLTASRAGRISAQDAERVRAAHAEGRALPSDILRKLANQ